MGTMVIGIGQAYCFHDREDGRTYWWNATQGRAVAEASGRPAVCADLKEAGMDCAAILRMYEDMDVGKALALPVEALFDPILFVTHQGKHVLIDGWHRLYRAASEGIDALPCWILTQEESDLVRMEGA